ncbi:MAG: MAPEG family protein [Bradyrhizobium sp.]|nr:MAPEG family protein [Bradyrhizobium sp.]
MHMPSITAFYLAILALLYAALALQVAGLRRRNRVLFGDADNGRLRAAIRVHANFIEYVPIVVLLVALLEMSGTPATRVHLLMGGLLLARLLHPMGMYARPGTWQFAVGRVGGIVLTITILISAALGALLRFWPI